MAFFGFLSLFPAIIAAVLAYGLVADPTQIRDQAESVAMALPSAARELLLQQIETLTATPQQSLGIGLIISLAAALWSASGGVGHLMSAVNSAYDEEETRGFVRRKALALLLTLGAIVFSLVTIGLIAVAPVVLDANDVSLLTRLGLEAARWLLLLGAVTVALAVAIASPLTGTPPS